MFLNDKAYEYGWQGFWDFGKIMGKPFQFALQIKNQENSKGFNILNRVFFYSITECPYELFF